VEGYESEVICSITEGCGRNGMGFDDIERRDVDLRKWEVRESVGRRRVD